MQKIATFDMQLRDSECAQWDTMPRCLVIDEEACRLIVSANMRFAD